MIEKFKTKPAVVEAIQFTSLIVGEVCDFTGIPRSCVADMDREYLTVSIPTLRGEMVAIEGDWIIKTAQGEFYPCKPDIFEQTYERVDGD